MQKPYPFLFTLHRVRVQRQCDGSVEHQRSRFRRRGSSGRKTLTPGHCQSLPRKEDPLPETTPESESKSEGRKTLKTVLTTSYGRSSETSKPSQITTLKFYTDTYTYTEGKTEVTTDLEIKLPGKGRHNFEAKG